MSPFIAAARRTDRAHPAIAPIRSQVVSPASQASQWVANSALLPLPRTSGSRLARWARLAYLRLCRRLGGLRACSRYPGM